MDLFLIYLILRFTKPQKKLTGQDLVLGKQVPFILLVQNYQLVKKTYKTELAHRSDQLRSIRAIAEANAFMYYKLKEEGITRQIDENIGIEFLNLDLIMSQHDSSPPMSHHSSGSVQTKSTNSRIGDDAKSFDEDNSDDALFEQVRIDFMRKTHEESGLLQHKSDD